MNIQETPQTSSASAGMPCWANGDGSVQLYHADCLDVLPFLTDISAVVSDPPYGIDFDCSKHRVSATPINDSPLSFRRWKKINGDDTPFDPSPWIHFEKVILWGGNHYADKLPASSCWLVWDKKVDTTPDNFSDCELAWTNLPGVVKKFSHLWRGMVRAGRENISNGPKLHPFQKPEALMHWCLSLCKLAPRRTRENKHCPSPCRPHGLVDSSPDITIKHLGNSVERHPVEW